MNLKGKSVGFAITGSFYAFKKTFIELKKISELQADITPIMSFNSYFLDTKLGKAKDIRQQIIEITGKNIVHTIPEAELISTKKKLDVLIVAPCTGNTISKLAYDITDTPVTIAVQSHLRNLKPVVIAVSTNNGLSGNAENIGKLLNRKHYYFVPFRQDNPITKTRSISFDSTYIVRTLEYALDGEQIQPILL